MSDDRKPVEWFRLPVGPAEWTVLLSTPDVSDALNGEDGDEAEGAMQNGESAMYVNANMRRDRWAEIVIHELLHAVHAVVGIHKVFNFDDAKEERLVSLLAPTLTDALIRGGLLKMPRVPRLPRKRRKKASGDDVEVTVMTGVARKAKR